ncbi:transcription factor Tfb2 [Atractiella rhizophila]|nr:transcription factor Tfb2 [Atractiella rhizophila]
MSTLQKKTIQTFLPDLPPSTLHRIYALPSNVLAVFRLLPPLARQVVMNLLWLPVSADRKGKGKAKDGGVGVGGVEKGEMEMWMKKGEQGKSLLNAALEVLQRLSILSLSPSTQSYTLNSSFSTSLRLAILGGGNHQSFGVISPSSTRDNEKSLTFLDRHAKEKWETILHFLVSPSTQVAPTRQVLGLLERGGFMNRIGRNLDITSRGFGFLLEEMNAQIWEILLVYLEGCSDRDMDLVEVLSCIFMLGSLELGKAYKTSPLSPTVLSMLQDLRDYGLVYIDPKQPDRFFPTRLATTLTSSSIVLPNSEAQMKMSEKHVGVGEIEEEGKGFIIVETNYKVYAYTNNALQVSLLGLFVHLRSRFANLVVGMITRESIKEALAKGITADQIVAYLTANAHPQMLNQNPLLPPTVVDQIRLWELEKNRIRTHEGFLYDDFHTREDFELVMKYADELGALLWKNEVKMLLFVEGSGNDAVRSVYFTLHDLPN